MMNNNNPNKSDWWSSLSWLAKIGFYIAFGFLVILFLILKDSISENDNKKELDVKQSIAEKNEVILEVKNNFKINELEGLILTLSEIKGGYQCKNEPNYKCISLSEFQKSCELIDGIANRTITMLGKYPYAFPGPDVEYILDNGGYEGYSKELAFDAKNQPLCKVKLHISGIYKGSQVKRDLPGYITSFMIKGGKVIAYEAAVDYPY